MPQPDWSKLQSTEDILQPVGPWPHGPEQYRAHETDPLLPGMVTDGPGSRIAGLVSGAAVNGDVVRGAAMRSGADVKGAAMRSGADVMVMGAEVGSIVYGADVGIGVTVA